jgi:rhomboid family GlyGly-CTERM serine protease
VTLYPADHPEFDRDRPIRSVAVPAVLALVCGLLAAGGDRLRLLGRYERSAVADGELWRLLTGHLVHLGWGHLLMNLVALAALTLLFRRRLGAADWLTLAACSVLAIDAGLYWLEPGIVWYVGLSGLLHGLWCGGGLQELLDPRGRVTGVVLLLSLAAKLVWEQLAGPVPLSAETAGGAVVVEAHLYGSIGGLVWFALKLSLNGLRARRL